MASGVLKNWINVLKYRWKSLLLSFFIPAIIALGVSLIIPKKYKSTVKALIPEVASGGMYLQTPLGTITRGGMGTPISSQAVISILKSNYVADRTLRKFNIQELLNFNKFKVARKFFKTEMLQVFTNDIEGVIEITIKSRYNDLNPEIANYIVTLVDSANVELELSTETNIMKVVEWAEPAVKKYSPRYSINTLLGGVLGAFVFLVYIYYKEDLSLIDE